MNTPTRNIARGAVIPLMPPELRMFVASLDVTRETGGNLAEVFLKLAEAIRAKQQPARNRSGLPRSPMRISARRLVKGGSGKMITPGRPKK